MAELVDALDSKSSSFGSVGSIPTQGTLTSYIMRGFFTLAFSHPDLTSITIWNLTDLNAWRGHAGGILDKELNPKKSFYALKKLIKEDWSTKTEIIQKVKKPIVFNGFYGDYLGEVTIDDIKYNFSFNHSAGNNEAIKVIIQ